MRSVRCPWVLVFALVGCTEAQQAAGVEPAIVEPTPAVAPPEVVGRPTSEPVVVPTPERAQALELTFVGDVVLGRYLEHRGDDVFVEMQPASADPFADVASLLAADVVVGNLESPVVRELPPRPPIEHRVRFAGSAAHVQQLVRGGFDVMSLANNHYFDLGVAGQLEGPEVLAEANVFAIGASRSETPMLRVETLEVRGWRIGFLAFATVRNHVGKYGGPQLPYTQLHQLDELDATLALARAEHDLLIVMVHWGVEYSDEVGSTYRMAARKLLDAGVDLVIGHHPHVLQALEVREHGLIAYSLGNFLFPRNEGGPGLSGVLRVRYVDGPEGERPCLEQARMHPVQLIRKPSWHPEPARGYVVDRVHTRMIELSRLHSTRLRADGDDLLVEGLRACNTVEP